MADIAIKQYAGLMKEVMLRMEVISFFGAGPGHALYEPTTVESMYLQLRKILELIAMASLVANKALYAAAYDDFAKEWNARRLLKKIKTVNPDFYPKPIVEYSSKQSGVKADWKTRAGDYLTADEFLKAYEECGAILHWGNPFRAPLDYAYFKRKLPRWFQQVMNLLNSHTIRLVNEERTWLIHMKEDRDNEVHYYVFEPTEIRS